MRSERKVVLFFRNDDVRGVLDDELIHLTELFLARRIPITHAVEPANVTRDVVDWLLKMKRQHPDLFEIMQHGYDHSIKNKFRKGEFGGQRTYAEQYADIKAGKELMNEWFGDQWFEAFNFPYAPYNPAAIRAANAVGFRVLNSHYNNDWKRRLFYLAGHVLRRGFLLNHHVSWNLRMYPRTSLFEIDMNVSFIKRYIDEVSQCEFFTLDELKQRTLRYAWYPTIGLLLHHRYHRSDSSMSLVADYLDWGKEQGFSFQCMQSIFEAYAPRRQRVC